MEQTLSNILAIIQNGFGAAAAAIWRQSPHGHSRLAAIGQEELPVEPPKRSPPGGKLFTLTSDGEPIGLFLFKREELLSDHEKIALGALSNLIASVIAAGEQSERFAETVESSSRTVEAQHRFMQCVVDSLPVGLYVVDQDYRVHAWNRKRETGMQGVLREDAMGRTIFEILRRQPADLLRREFDEVFNSGEIMVFEMQSGAGGQPRTYRVSKIPMRIDGDGVTHVITIGEDITDWKRAQDRIAESQRLAALGQLSAGVMHEINNPMATIGACAETMAMQFRDLELPDAVRSSFDEYCHIIDHEVHRCKRIVDGLLDFSRPQGREKGSVSINEVVEQTLFLLKHHQRFRQMRANTELGQGDGLTVNGGRDQLVQVIMALLINATDAMQSGGTITIRTMVRGDTEVVAEVVDQGHGIPATELGKLFEPFYTTKSPGRGTGLGLAICYGIVADHGGHIEVESTVGVGSTFRVCLPALTSEVTKVQGGKS